MTPVSPYWELHVVDENDPKEWLHMNSEWRIVTGSTSKCNVVNWAAQYNHSAIRNHSFIMYWHLSLVVRFIFYNCIIFLFVVSKPSLWTIDKKKLTIPSSNIYCFNTYKIISCECVSKKKINLLSLRSSAGACCVCTCTVCVMYCV